jgi:hypothetical protein
MLTSIFVLIFQMRTLGSKSGPEHKNSDTNQNCDGLTGTTSGTTNAIVIISRNNQNCTLRDNLLPSPSRNIGQTVSNSLELEQQTNEKNNSTEEQEQTPQHHMNGDLGNDMPLLISSTSSTDSTNSSKEKV